MDIIQTRLSDLEDYRRLEMDRDFIVRKMQLLLKHSYHKDSIHARKTNRGICCLLTDSNSIYYVPESTFLRGLRIHIASTYGPAKIGNFIFPVPSPTKKYSNSEAYYNLPKWTGQYGRNRRAYLRYMICWIKDHYVAYRLLETANDL